MGVEPMTYGFFGFYKAVALPLSYRGERRAVSEAVQDKISRHTCGLGRRVRGSHSHACSDQGVYSWQTLT